MPLPHHLRHPVTGYFCIGCGYIDCQGGHHGVKLLNLGCGGHRPPPPFCNVDSLFSLFQEGQPERDQLEAEQNYLDTNLLQLWPFADLSIDGILASHFFEHFHAMQGVHLAHNCYKALVPGGCLRVSVPDASYFRAVNAEDTKANAVRLFGEPMPASDPKETFMAYALFFEAHRMIYDEDTLWCLLRNAGFAPEGIRRVSYQETTEPGHPAAGLLAGEDNRACFSLYLEAFK